MPPDSYFLELVGDEVISLLRTAAKSEAIVFDFGKVSDEEMKILENQNMKGVPVWWEKPIFVAFVVWVPNSMIVLPEGVLVSYAGELLVMVKTRLSAKEFNRLVHFGKVIGF